VDRRENNGGDEPIWGIIFTYMEMSQRNPLYKLTEKLGFFQKICRHVAVFGHSVNTRGDAVVLDNH
jgi:hypothetical protein